MLYVYIYIYYIYAKHIYLHILCLQCPICSLLPYGLFIYTHFICMKHTLVLKIYLLYSSPVLLLSIYIYIYMQS